MLGQRYGVACDGTPCVTGLTWAEAAREAQRLMAALTEEPDGVVVTVSEVDLDEPRVSWVRCSGQWMCLRPGDWAQDAA